MNDLSDHGRFATVEEVVRTWTEGGPGAEALAAACLAAISADSGSGRTLNAIRWINPRALEQARTTDRAEVDPARPLAGVPVALKDNIDVIGTPTTSGNRAMISAMPRRNAGIVERLTAAGAILLAKTNLSEFSFEIRSRSSLSGDVLNPFDRAVTAGGSSGGAAAAVAAGFALAAVGTDTGGSIRTPASFNGLVGLRPTHGLVDRSGVAPLAPSTDTVGIITRSVGDADLLLGCLTGCTPRAPQAACAGAAHALRLGAFRQAFGVDRDIVAAANGAIDRLTSLGATVVDPITFPESLLAFGGDHIVDWEFRPAFDHYLATNFAVGAPTSLAAILASGAYLEDYREILTRRLTLGDADSPIYRAILASHQRLASAVDALFETHELDALVYPTSMVVPTSLDNPKGGWAPELAARTGRPAVTLPVALSSGGIPIGIELLGKLNQEAALLDVARILEHSISKRFFPTLLRVGGDG